VDGTVLEDRNCGEKSAVAVQKLAEPDVHGITGGGK